MAASNNPLVPVQNIVVKLRNRLLQFLRSVWNKVKSLMRSVMKFLNKLKSAAKSIIGVIGKSAYNKLVNIANTLMIKFPIIEKLANNALKMADQILAFIKKAADPNKAIKFVKKFVTRFVKMFRQVFAFVKDVLDAISPLDAALSVLSKFVMVLKMMISWITDVTGVLSAVKKIKSMLRKAFKELKAGLKEAVQLAKEAGKLKPA